MHSRPLLTKGPVGAHLRAMTIPMIWGILSMMLFNVVDTWFVARLGAAELAAMSFTFPVVMTLTSVSIGLGAGTSSVLARAIGVADASRVKRVATDSLILSTLIVIALLVIGYLTMDPVFRLLGATDDVLVLIREYMVPWYAGLIFMIVPMVGMASIRATGDTRAPSRIMIIASLINVVVDPILIFGLLGFPRLELAGAAYATVLARAMTLAATVWILQNRMHLLTFEIPNLRELISSWKGILHVGLPAAGTNMIIPLANGVIVAMVASFGTAAVAGLGVATRIEAFSMIVFYAMSGIIGPFVGQNLGAGRRDRILLALKQASIFCMAFGVFLAVVLGVFATPLATFFTAETTVVEVATQYLRILPISYGTAGIIMVVNASFNGLGRPLPATMISVTRMVIVYIPLAFLGRNLWGVPGIFAAAALTNLLVGAGAVIWNRAICNRTPQRAIDDAVEPVVL